MTGHEIYLLICLLMKFYQVSYKRHGNGCSIAVFFKICKYLLFLTQLRNKKLQRESKFQSFEKLALKNEFITSKP